MWKVVRQHATQKMHIISAEQKTFISRLSGTKNQKPCYYRDAFLRPSSDAWAKVEFSQPMQSHVWFHFIYICHRWLSAITVCQQTVDSYMSLVFSHDNNALSVLF